MSSEHPAKGSERGLFGLLERGDQLAHLIVSALLLLTALGVLVAGTYYFIGEVIHARTTAESFANDALEYLSSLLFAVILLELLSTLLTYVRSKNLEATIKDFLIVGIISGVRKILLVGAHSSLTPPTMDDFVKESIGTGLTIVGILLLIGGLILLEMRRVGGQAGTEGS